MGIRLTCRFLRALADEFAGRGHEICWTARDYAQTVELARNAGLDADVFGTHGGGNLFAKGAKFTGRVIDLMKWSRGRGIDLVVSHNSLEPLAVARLRGINSVNLMDYEHHPNNHISFRLAQKVVVPVSFPEESLRKFGAFGDKVKRFDGIKEDVYLAGFRPDAAFQSVLLGLGVRSENILIVVRPHAPDALYHRGFENELLGHVLDRFAADERVKIVVVPRNPSSGGELRARHPQPNIIVAEKALDGGNLIAAADLVVSGGGTMNREAAALGVPTATIFTGRPAAIDEYLCREGRMIKLKSIEDVNNFRLVKKDAPNLRAQSHVRAAGC